MMKLQEEIKPTGVSAESERREPGRLRELDAQIASKVLGWTNVEADCYTPIGKEWCGDDPEGTGGFYRTGRKIIRRYSQDRSAAMEVVDHFAEADWRVMLTSNPHAPQTLRWRVELFKELSPNNISVMELAETLPEAICLAALSAKAAEVNTR